MSPQKHIPISYQVQCTAPSEGPLQPHRQMQQPQCGFLARTSEDLRLHHYTVHARLQAPSMHVYACDVEGCKFVTERRWSRESLHGGVCLEDLVIREEGDGMKQVVVAKDDEKADKRNQRDPFVLQAIATLKNHYFQAHHQAPIPPSFNPSPEVSPGDSPDLPPLRSPTLPPVFLPLPVISSSPELPPPLLSPTLPSSSPLPYRHPYKHHHHHHRYRQTHTQNDRDPSSSPPQMIDHGSSSPPGQDPFYWDVELDSIMELDGLRVGGMDGDIPAPTLVAEESSAQERLWSN